MDRYKEAVSFGKDSVILWRRKWQLAPVFLPGESHGQRSLVGYRPWGHKESDRTERLSFTHSVILGHLVFLLHKVGENILKQ